MKSVSSDYIEFLSSKEILAEARKGALWKHQWEAFLRVVYAHKILGKTAIIAAVIAWLRIACEVQKFVLLCPNLIVRDRLEDDFQGGKVFRDRDLLPDWAPCWADNFTLTTLGSGKECGWYRLLSAQVIFGQHSSVLPKSHSGRNHLAALMNGPKFAVFNDEAHNSLAPEYEETLVRMREKIALRLDTTATPDRAVVQTPDSAKWRKLTGMKWIGSD